MSRAGACLLIHQNTARAAGKNLLIPVMNVITMCGTDFFYFMNDGIVVTLTDGRRIVADEVAVPERTGGEWLRCVRQQPSARMGFDETTTYYHLDRDVECVYATETAGSPTPTDLDRQSILALTTARSEN
jgi:hypothetical protein